MGRPIDFAGSNMTLHPPEGAENVVAMRTFTNGICSVSCWELTENEIAEIVRDRRLFVSIFSGQTQPPVFIGAETDVRSVVVDFGGVWQRGRA